MTSIYERMTAELQVTRNRSAWGRGVNAYALELVEDLAMRAEYEGRNPENAAELVDWLLNGADDWSRYSWGGSALIYNGDIALRLCSASELKRTRNGERRPNAREYWLDVQARALTQAARVVEQIWSSFQQLAAMHPELFTNDTPSVEEPPQF